MELGNTQAFASPGEALEHFGIKGMRWGHRKDRDKASGFDSYGESYSGGFDHGLRDLRPLRRATLRVDHSKGFADIRSAEGFKTESARKSYEQLSDGLKEMRDQYPSVAAAKIELMPMSATRISRGLMRSGAPAAVFHGKDGEIRVVYNDRLKDFSPKQQKDWEEWVPGMAHEGYINRHEMGHVLASAAGIQKPAFDVMKEKNLNKLLKKLADHDEAEQAAHYDMFKKHGLDPDKVAQLSPYAATSRQESLAELVGNYNTPAMRKNMDPDMQRRTKALIDDLGGKK